MTTVIGEVEARERFSELMDRVHDDGEEVIVESAGEPLAAMVPIDLYQRYLAEREARFAVVERFRESLPDYPEAEVLTDIDEAIRAVRRDRAHRDS